MFDYLHHLLFPRESNNHRPRVLHTFPLFILILILFSLVLILPRIGRIYPDVLGIKAEISISDLVSLTNQERLKVGLPPLNLDNELSNAAYKKAEFMLEKNFWSHNAPDGTTPWVFIKSSGYDYLYAGENLARGFTTAPDAMNAWMASAGHKSNILSPNYKDIGFAVVQGNLTGDDTVLIVEMFGERLNTVKEVGSVQTQAALPTPQPTVISQQTSVNDNSIPNQFTPSIQPSTPLFFAAIKNNPKIDKDSLSRNFALILLLFFIIVFLIDMIIIERKQIIRLVSHNADHIIFLVFLLTVILLFGRGFII